MKFPSELAQMNRSQMLVLVIAGLASGYILVQRFVIPNDCLGRMCPVNDLSWVWQVGTIMLACVLAYWLLKSSK